MISEKLIGALQTLNAEQQDSVFEFVTFLKERTGPKQSAFLDAVDSFISEHPELLSRLAQ